MTEGNSTLVPARRWFQFSMRGLLAFVPSAGLGIAAFMKWNGPRQAFLQANTPKNVVAATFLFILSFGIISAIAGRGYRAIVEMAIALQIVSGLSMAVATFGFDHQSEWGLDFSDLMRLWGIYGVSFLGGLSTAYVSEWDKAATFQLRLLPIMGATIFVVKAVLANI